MKSRKIAVKAFFTVCCFAIFSCSEKKEENDGDLEIKEIEEIPPDVEDAENMDFYDSQEIESDDIIEAEEEVTNPFEGYCRACRKNEDCPEGGACLNLDNGEMSCSLPCDLPTDCPAGSSCLNVSESETRQCKPDSGTCVRDKMGDPCRAWGCSGRNDVCSDPSGSNGYCTHRCETRIDCEAGFMQCNDRGDGVKICMKEPLPPPQRCGTTEHPSGIGSPCGSATCSDPVFICVNSINPLLPAFCTRSCSSDSDCSSEEGSICREIRLNEGNEKFCLPDECSCFEKIPDSLLDTLLNEVGLDRCELFWDTETMTTYFGNSVTHDRFRIPWTDDAHNEWLRGGREALKIESKIDEAVQIGMSKMIYESATLAGHPFEETEKTYEPADTNPLASALESLVISLGETPDRPSYELDASDIPMDIQQFTARVLLAIQDAIKSRNDAISSLGGNRWEINRYYNSTPGFVLPSFGIIPDPTDRKVQDFLIGDFRYELIYEASYHLIKTIEQYANSIGQHSPDEHFSFNQSTSAGRVTISDARDNSLSGPTAGSESYLLVIDIGGNDHYEISAGANTNPENPVSVLIDFGGNDTYGYYEVPDPDDGGRLVSDLDGRVTPTSSYGPFSLSRTSRQGSGRLGIGILVDFGAGDDRYRSLRISQGSGILGVGILYDDGGSDIYECEAGCQGSGIFGMGILMDMGEQGGTSGDTFSSYNASQGFAYAQGIGILYNEKGNDIYFCNQDDVLYPSPQDSLSNSSLCQGMGFGRRSDEALGGDGVYMSGGIGILRDLEGWDEYTCAIFGQGSGYWFGFGFLLDGQGSDHYDGRWYVQASSAHFATAVLHDAGGDDYYNANETRRLNIILGGGHDFSNSFLLDDEGNDHYFAPNLSFGTGNDNGFGLFVDNGGDDEMECTSDYSFGNASITPSMGRGIFPSAGIFMECGGIDSYTRPNSEILGNDKIWTQKVHPDSRSEYGAGGDTTTLNCIF